MATAIQNSTSIITATFDPLIPTNAQMLKVANAFVHEASDEAIQAVFGKAKADLTTAEKARVMNAEVERWVRVKMRDHAAYLKQQELQSQIDAAAEAGNTL